MYKWRYVENKICNFGSSGAKDIEPRYVLGGTGDIQNKIDKDTVQISMHFESDWGILIFKVIEGKNLRLFPFPCWV